MKNKIERKKLQNNSIHARITDGEMLMVKSLMEKFGGISVTDLFRRIIYDRYKKEFPFYVVAKGNKNLPAAAVELTGEQICEQCKGKVIEEDGIKKCQLTLRGGSSYTLPLSMTEKIQALAKQFKLIP